MRYYDSSLLVGTLVPDLYMNQFNIGNIVCPSKATIGNLTSIRNLYLYTETPPLAMGGQNSKVFETVLRAYQYNFKKTNKILQLPSGLMTERLYWEKDDGPFLVHETLENYVSIETKEMIKVFILRHYPVLNSACEKTINHLTNTNSDVLTAGRQTSCAFTNQSVPAAAAYKRVYDFFKDNLGQSSFNCLD